MPAVMGTNGDVHTIYGMCLRLAMLDGRDSFETRRSVSFRKSGR